MAKNVAKLADSASSSCCFLSLFAFAVLGSRSSSCCRDAIPAAHSSLLLKPATAKSCDALSSGAGRRASGKSDCARSRTETNQDGHVRTSVPESLGLAAGLEAALLAPTLPATHGCTDGGFRTSTVWSEHRHLTLSAGLHQSHSVHNRS